MPAAEPEPPDPAPAIAGAALVLRHLEIVSRNATSIGRHLGKTGVRRDELMAEGFLVLVKRSQTFDPKKAGEGERRVCSAFAAFARKAVRGAMWDTARRRQWRELSHEALSNQTADSGLNPEAAAALAERSAITHEAMSRALDERECFVVEHYYAETFGVTRSGLGDLGEIGRHLPDIGFAAVSASNASRIHCEATAKLRRYMTTRGFAA
jgi:RNA polymerase sigma factor (sigma-70 family)